MNTHRYDNTMSLQGIGLRQPEAAVAGLTLRDDPVKRLLAIDDAFQHWPTDLATTPQNTQTIQMTPARRGEVTRLGSHVAQIHRALANVGAVPEQLALLDEALQRELALLTREAGWQLRTLARQTRCRWNAEPGEYFPDAPQTWLVNVETVVTGITSKETADEPAVE